MFQMATSLVEFTLIYLVGAYGESDIAIALVLFAYKFPAIIMSVVSGILVDRYDRRRVLLWATLVRVFGALVTLFFIDKLVALVLFALVFSLAGHLFKTAEGALLPEIVEGDDLMQAAGLFNMTEHGTTLIGLIVTFPLLSIFLKKLTWLNNEVLGTLGMAAILFSSAAVMLMNVTKIKRKDIPKKQDSSGDASVIWQKLKGEMLDGWRYVKNTPVCVRMISHLVLLNTMILVVMATGKAFGLEILGAKSMTEIGVSVILPTIGGFVFAVFLIPFLQKKFTKLQLIYLGVLLAGIVFLIIGTMSFFFPWFGIESWSRIFVYVSQFLVGFSVVCALIPAFVTLQEKTEDRLRGRAFGILFSSITAISAIPLIGVGYLVEKYGVIPLLISLGILSIVYAGYLVSAAEKQKNTEWQKSSL